MRFFKAMVLFFVSTYLLLASSNWTERFELQNKNSMRGPLLSGSITRYQNGAIDLEYGRTQLKNAMLNQSSFSQNGFTLDTLIVGGGYISSLTRDNFVKVLKNTGLWLENNNNNGNVMPYNSPVYSPSYGERMGSNDTTVVVVNNNQQNNYLQPAPPQQQTMGQPPQNAQQSQNPESNSTCCDCEDCSNGCPLFWEKLGNCCSWSNCKICCNDKCKSCCQGAGDSCIFKCFANCFKCCSKTVCGQCCENFLKECCNSNCCSTASSCCCFKWKNKKSCDNISCRLCFCACDSTSGNFQPNADCGECCPSDDCCPS